MHTLKQKVDVEAPRLLGYQNASKTRTLSTKVYQKCVALGKKSTSKPFRFFRFWDTRMHQVQRAADAETNPERRMLN